MASDATNPTTNPNDKNGRPSDEMIQRALAVLAAQEAKEAEKARKAQERRDAKAAQGPVPNAPHAFLTILVDAMTAADVAYAEDDELFRTYLRTLRGFVDTAARGENINTARDFEVIGQIIKTTQPAVPSNPTVPAV